MRARTLFAGMTLALLTVAWSAPSALAAEDDTENNSNSTTSSAPAEPGDTEGEKSTETEPSEVTETPEPEPEPEPEPDPTQQQRIQQVVPEQQQQQVLPTPTAELSVTPTEVYPGDSFTVDASCTIGAVTTLTVDGQQVDPGTFQVPEDAEPGSTIPVTLLCEAEGEAKDDATATVTVKELKEAEETKDDPRYDSFLDLDPNYADRGDEVDATAYCPGDGDARLESDVLDDITLYRGDDDKLRGTTHVEDDAERGWDSATVLCDNGDRPYDGIYVRDDRDFAEFLDLDPSFGHRGDEVDVYVQCDDDLGRLESDVLTDIDLDRDGRYYHGTARVEDDAEFGEDTVEIECGDDTLTEAFFVQGDDNDYNGGGTQVSVYPKGAPETGGGPAEDSPLGLVALGATGLAGAAGIAGSGRYAARRGTRR